MRHPQLAVGRTACSLRIRRSEDFYADDPGELIVTIDHADPVIKCTEEFLGEADSTWVQVEGDLVTFTASNGTWIYRVIGYDFLTRTYTLAWPD